MQARTVWCMLGIVSGAILLLRAAWHMSAMPPASAGAAFTAGWELGHAAAPIVAAAPLVAGVVGLLRRPRRSR